MSRLIFGIGIYMIAYIICYKEGLFNSFEKYRFAITRLSVRPKMGWVINFAICPLCVSLPITLATSWIGGGDYLYNLILSFAGIFIANKLIDRDDDTPNSQDNIFEKYDKALKELSHR